MFADVNGTQNVMKYIQNSGHTKYIISKYGVSKSSINVTDSINTNTNKAAVENFYQWAQTCGSGRNPNLYCITLFSDLDDKGKTPGKSGKCEIVFSLNEETAGQTLAGHTSNAPEFTEMSVKLALAERDKEDYKREMAELRRDILELKNNLISQEEEEEEEENAEMGSPDKILNYVQMIQALFNNNTTKQSTPTLNGVETEERKSIFTPEQIKNINSALATLYKTDQQIDTDLLKLANISQTQPATFKMLLNSLRNM